MKVYFGFENTPRFDKAVATMGSYDGVHSGHRVLLSRVIHLAQEKQAQSVVITFDPHPRYVLGSGANLSLLNSLEEKIYLLEKLGIDNLIVVPFTEEFSQKTPAEFIEKDIIPTGIGTLVVGYNHRFGHNKEGDFNYLESRENSLEIHRVEQHLIAESKVSSTIVRQLVSKGMMERAAKLLSHPYIIQCKVEADGSVGNIPREKLLPPKGEYEVIAGDSPTVLKIDSKKNLSLPAREQSKEIIIKF